MRFIFDSFLTVLSIAVTQLTLAVARLVWMMLTMSPRQEVMMRQMPARLVVPSTEARNPGGSRYRGSVLWDLKSAIIWIYMKNTKYAYTYLGLTAIGIFKFIQNEEKKFKAC